MPAHELLVDHDYGVTAHAIGIDQEATLDERPAQRGGELGAGFSNVAPRSAGALRHLVALDTEAAGGSTGRPRRATPMSRPRR